ncbi:DUF2026 domain-containing protein [Rhodobacteraceae bacterium LMO-12]|nr:DUF2026 domain-containing protein [Rhodobacteraceae bacterium LMO-JJ12]
MTTRTMITLAEFNLISTAIQGLLKQTDYVQKIETSCTLFATFGAAILTYHLGIPCQPVAGGWHLHHPDGVGVLAFGQKENRQIRTTENGFHMWVQTESHIIDFMSPLYPEIFVSEAATSPLPRQMLQLNRKLDAESQTAFLQGAPLMTMYDDVLAKSLIERVAGNVVNDALVRALLTWWPLLEKTPDAELALGVHSGKRLKISRSGHGGEGLWRGPSDVAPPIQ